MKVTRTVSGWLALSGESKWVMSLMLFGLPVVAALVRVVGVMPTLRILERTSRAEPRRDLTPSDLDFANEVTHLAEIAGVRGIVPSSCLRQSLAVYWILRRRGLSPDLKIGVRRIGSALDAHAWIELNGERLGKLADSHSVLGALTTSQAGS